METVIEVSQHELLTKLKTIGRISQPKNTAYPAAGWFRFRRHPQWDDALSVTATDMTGEMSAKVKCEKIENNVDFCIDSRVLLEILPQIPDQPLKLTVNPDKRLSVEYWTGSFEIPLHDENLFPEISMNLTDNMPLYMKTEIIATGFKQVIDFTGKDEVRPVMTSVLMDIKKDEVTFVASSGHVLSKQVFEYSAEVEQQLIIPNNAAKLILSMIDPEVEEANIEITKKNFMIEIGDFTMVYLLTEGKYPNYRSVIPAHKWTAKVDRQVLLGAIRRTSVFSPDGSGMIAMYFIGDKLRITSKDMDYNQSGEESIPVSYDGESFQIGFNSKQLILLLSSVSDKHCEIRLTTPGQAATIIPEETAGVTLLIMPMIIE
ncbi:MAG: DNA polymerase III subunit beta [Proteiniphilum sp.]